jgi:hypothetical protein
MIEEEIRLEGVSKDIQSYTDILARQILYINQVISTNAPAKLIENAISVFEATISPYVDQVYYNELKDLEHKRSQQLRFMTPDRRNNSIQDLLLGFYIQKYALLLKHAKQKGFLPKTLKQEY